MISEETVTRLLSACRNPKRVLYNILGHSELNPEEENWRTLRNLVLGMPERDAAQYAKELEWTKKIPLDCLHAILIPYARKTNADASGKCESGFSKGFVYVRHKGQSLFFPKHVTVSEATATYFNYIHQEGILGTGSLTKSPHAYVCDSFKVESGDVLLDVGCAEALFALDNAEKASQIYLFEFLKKWRKPLALTFAPYKHKTHVIPKFVSDHTDSKSIRLVDALPHCGNATYFIKMDIEGNERFVLESSRDFLKTNKVKLACCVYHRQDDADYISNLLTELGYSVSFSDGYMLPTLNGIHFPYFRKGVIRAKNF